MILDLDEEGPILQERLYPVDNRWGEVEGSKLCQEQSVVDGVKRFTEVQIADLDRITNVQTVCNFVQEAEEVAQTGSSGSEAMLCSRYQSIFRNEAGDMVPDEAFQDLQRHTCDADRTIIVYPLLVTTFMDGRHASRFPIGHHKTFL